MRQSCWQITDDLSLLFKKKKIETFSIAKKKNNNNTSLPSRLLHISTVTHSVFLISPLTRVAWSIGLQAMLPSRELCVRLPPIWGIMCPSSNASYGPLIKRKLKSVWGGGGGVKMSPQSSDMRANTPVTCQMSAYISACKSDLFY